MPRSPRISIPNGCYHIITRGNQRQQVFKDQEDYNFYLHLLEKYKKRYNFKLYCFCLMSNHVHLVLEVEDPKKLSKIMQGINLSYTIYFNSKYKTVGHLWQDRFLSRILNKDEYFIKCLEYIETNPVRAQLVEDPLDYPWSSFKARTFFSPKIIDIPQL